MFRWLSFDLRKKLTFVGKTIVLDGENGSKRIIKVWTNGVVSFIQLSCVKISFFGEFVISNSRCQQWRRKKVNKEKNIPEKIEENSKVVTKRRLQSHSGKTYESHNLCRECHRIGCSYRSMESLSKMYQVWFDEESNFSDDHDLIKLLSLSASSTCNSCSSSKRCKSPGNWRSLKEGKKQSKYSLIGFCKNFFRDYRHALAFSMTLAQDGDVEKNPGPDQPGGGSERAATGRRSRVRRSNVSVTSMNVRGLNDETKLRHLVNYCYKKVTKDKDVIFLFQESFLTKPGKIPYLWRGNFFLTPGTGNSCGCITFLSNHINVIESKIIGNRGHVLVCQKVGDVGISYIVANIYAPCPNVKEKITFFEQVFETLGELELKYDCSNIILGGDFNLNFNSNETMNRNYSAQESRIAKIVLDLMREAQLCEGWKGEKKFTWRRPNTDIFSTIDKILISQEKFEVIESSTNWSVSFSDHAALEVELKLKESEIFERSKVTRLDPSLMKVPEIKAQIEREFLEMFKDAGTDWNPHLKLEFAKMCIRTVVEKAQADRKVKESSEEEEVDKELNLAIEALQNSNTEQRHKEDLIEYVEELRNKKALFIEKKGQRLAEKLGTKWYNEGEKSTKYFLRLLNRSNPDSFKSVENKFGVKVTSQKQIEEEVVAFYKDLYENYDKEHIVENAANDDFFKNLESVSAETEGTVTAPIGVEELGKTLSGCRDSAPGPDGIPYSYYKGLWRHLGPLLVEAWNYSVSHGKLCPSHKASFLRLIPKPGKDKSKLTNWRPITLSNCDHKLITKTYANRMSLAVAQKIKERQTAYIKGRLINDNVRALLGSINVANLDAHVDGLLVSLDAKKAFDSVEHNYIEKCLIKFGLAKFVPIFKTLYRELRSDVIINGRIVNGFKILRGVKQGDALSCILFIMCMEPLLRNIEENVLIEQLDSVALNSQIPKAYAYADDVNAVLKNNPEGLRELFCEYERLTRASGLELNADKTEIMHLKSINQNENDVTPLVFNVNYCRKAYRLESCQKVKVNGILLQQNSTKMKDANVDNAVAKMNKILKQWSMRHLSILGKILIAKTFAISQVIYIMQSFDISEKHIKLINNCLYKFIWNRNFSASKAPERINREITNTPIELGGLGMLDVSAVDKGIKLRALARIVESKHPFLKIIQEKIDWGDYFNPKIRQKVDGVSTEGIRILKEYRNRDLEGDGPTSDRKQIAVIKSLKLESIVSNTGKNSIAYFNARRAGIDTVGSLNPDLNGLGRFFKLSIKRKIESIIRLPGDEDFIRSGLYRTSFRVKNKFMDISKLSSKEFRNSIQMLKPILNLKIGVLLTPSESFNWGSSLRKVNSVRHKSTILKVGHGVVYTKEKLFRFGLIDSPNCARCGEVENLEHKFATCNYVNRIWEVALRLTSKLKNGNDTNAEILKEILGVSVGNNSLLLSIHGEILQRILYLKDNSDHLLHPKALVNFALKYVLKNERKAENKTEIASLLEC